MAKIELDKNEKEYLRKIVKGDLKELKKEGETVIHHWFPDFLAGEKKLEKFFEELVKKLE